MSIEQRLESIEEQNREILRLLRGDVEVVVEVPVRNSVRVAEMFARSAKNAERRNKREKLRQ